LDGEAGGRVPRVELWLDESDGMLRKFVVYNPLRASRIASSTSGLFPMPLIIGTAKVISQRDFNLFTYPY
jgi:hypothetical protein